MRRKAKAAVLHDADHLMLKTARWLTRDFQAINPEMEVLCDTYAALLRKDTVPQAREVVFALDDSDDPWTYKAKYQLASILKRYRFQKDTYSDQELIDKSILTFMETQDRIRAINLKSLSGETERVLEYARIYIANTLGMYDAEMHRSLCKFGKKATVGIPARKACEAERWELPLTGSQGQISWFEEEYSLDQAVQDYWKPMRDSGRSTYQEVQSLVLTLVPKTFKAFRAIMPNTTIGSYMSYGLGEMMRLALKRRGYDIKTLQQRHKVLAKEASVTKRYVTADLSSASDSISVALVERLFPPDWFKVLNQCRTEYVDLPNGHRVKSETFGTMGIGYTFSLQTLVFLSLLKAIEATMYHRWNRKLISVYGDDMIYHVPLHTKVMSVFHELGFVVNVEKTHVEDHFRESCGGDYFRGVDVRPFQPRNGAAHVRSKAYEAMLYKYINGLLMRWSEHEIAGTLRFLVTELENLTGRVKLVPGDFPDDSGVKCPRLGCWDFLQHAQVAKPVSIGHGLYRFSYLRLVPDRREEVRHGPYYWLRLRGCDPDSISYASGLHLERVPFVRIGKNKLDLSYLCKGHEPFLIPGKVRSTDDHGKHGRRLRRALDTIGIPNSGRYMRRSGTSAFEDRR